MATYTYTYDDFLKAAGSAGLMDSFSAADLQLAQQNPSAGMSILDAKQQYMNAATEADRLRANAAANMVRESYGGYSGGADGSGYSLTPLSPSSFNQQPQPTYQNNYADDLRNLYAQQLGYGDYNYGVAQPEYQNKYAGRIDDALNAVTNRDPFSFDLETNDLYPIYRKQYLREGKRAMEDALGMASAASAGMPSSYAGTAAGQAGDYYNTKLTDKIPELWQLAYNQYMNEQGLNQASLSALQGVEQNEYGKYLNELGQYNTNRNFDYGVWTDGYNMIGNNLATAQNLEQNEYLKYMDELTQYNQNRNFDYGVLGDEISKQSADWERQYTLAQLAAAAGDLTHLQRMGIDTSNYPTNQATGGGSGGGGSEGIELSPNQLADEFSKGNWSDEIIAAMLAAGWTKEQLIEEGYKGNYFLKNSGNQHLFIPDQIGSPHAPLLEDIYGLDRGILGLKPLSAKQSYTPPPLIKPSQKTMLY